MNELKVKIKLLYEDSILPRYATDGSNGLDCVAHEVIYDDVHDLYRYPLGFAIEIPKGYVGLLFPRSSSPNRKLIMANCVGVIDSDFRGEPMATYNYKDNNIVYEVGEKVAQLVIVPAPVVKLEIVEDLSSTERGSKGHGSTGDKA